MEEEEQPQIILEDPKPLQNTRPDIRGCSLCHLYFFFWILIEFAIGMLEKSGDKGLIKTWKKRYFYLDEHNLLHYQESEAAAVTIGHIPIVKAVEAGTTIKTRPDIDPNAFCIDIPGRSFIMRVLPLVWLQ